VAYPFTDDHNMIREAARGFLQEWYDGGKGPERIYQSAKAFDAQAWKSFAQELGMAGIAIDENYGPGCCHGRIRCEPVFHSLYDDL